MLYFCKVFLVSTQLYSCLMNKKHLKEFLDRKVFQYNDRSFISEDPISIPHFYSKLQDIEIMGFISATFAWGHRMAVIKKCTKLGDFFDFAPHDFMLNHQPSDLKKLEGFKHRTFKDVDLLNFIKFFKNYYQNNTTLETAFSQHMQPNDPTIENALIGFHELFGKTEGMQERTIKHLSTPARRSACKRLCMYLRWMVRKDKQGVDLGLWNSIKPSQLVCPLDVHVERHARELGLIYHPKTNWIAALELTDNLRELDPEDPIKYDFALFGMGLEAKTII